MGTDAGLRVRQLRFDEVDAAVVAAWADLEERALEPNAYLSPSFVIPALRHLSSDAAARKTLFVLVERPRSGAADLLAVGVFVRSRGEPRFPLPHLRSFLSPHSYISGLFLDRDEGEAALRAMFAFLRGKQAPWHGVDFPCLPADGAQAQAIFRAARELGCTWHERTRSARALFVPAEGGEAYLQAHLSAHRLKKLRQTRRRLEGHGKVEWRALFGAEVTEASVEGFLDLEHRGWKAEQGTSLRSRPAHEAFFRELVEGFRGTGKLFFTELLLDGALVASTSNLVSGGAGFAFKIGWDPKYAAASPGLLNEVEFVREAGGPCRGLVYVDSGAEEGSFIEQLWAGRRFLAHGVFSTTPMGRAALVLAGGLRRCKSRLGFLRGAP
jgi:CelD/BcsL family acetyltransferase involved in cellulose biosynthesis